MRSIDDLMKAMYWANMPVFGNFRLYTADGTPVPAVRFEEPSINRGIYPISNFIVLDRMLIAKPTVTEVIAGSRPLKEVFEKGRQLQANFVARQVAQGNKGYFYFFKAKDPFILEQEAKYRVDI